MQEVATAQCHSGAVLGLDAECGALGRAPGGSPIWRVRPGRTSGSASHASGLIWTGGQDGCLRSLRLRTAITTSGRVDITLIREAALVDAHGGGAITGLEALPAARLATCGRDGVLRVFLLSFVLWYWVLRYLVLIRSI